MFQSIVFGLAFGQLAFSASVPVRRDSGLQTFTLDGWQSLGCWSDSQSSRTLSIAAHFGEHVDDDNCQYQCTQLGWNYAGVEYSGQCYCGNSVNSIATQKPDSDCYMTCNGNQSQPCGGPDRINLFWNGKTATPAPTVSTNPGIDGWALEGCYTDSTAGRTLGHKVDTAGGASAMTIQTCVDACNAAGYTLAGAEYADECYCDNTYTHGALATDQTTCSMTCKGNASEYCGGPGTMNLYSLGGATPVQVAPAASSSVTPVKPSVPSNWATLGCYSDSNGQRALSHFFNAPSSGMTVETCINFCSTNGYTIAGVEYGSECYCDSTVQNNHGLASDGNTGCNMPCSGNAGETCGGPNRLNVYAAGGEWVQLGCFTDQPYSRTLSYVASYSGDLTVEKCLASCSAAGFPYSGVEYGDECHCGFSFDNGGGPAPDGSAGCSFTCAGNSNEICGGSQRLSLYEYINSDGSVSSKAPSASPTSGSGSGAGSSPAASSTPEPVTSGLVSGWYYSACYVDQTGQRILTNQQPDSSSLTPQSCVSTCSGAGYSVAGVEYSSQCFCGNAVVNGGAQASGDVAASQCHMSCSGDNSVSCGGPGLMDIYYTGTLTIEAAPTVQTDNLPGNFKYVGCVSDNAGQRTFPYQANVESNDATTCLSACLSNGYTTAGLEYGNQCFCGAADSVSSSGAMTSTGCTMACAGDSSYICGGAGALTYYSSV